MNIVKIYNSSPIGCCVVLLLTHCCCPNNYQEFNKIYSRTKYLHTLPQDTLDNSYNYLMCCCVPLHQWPKHPAHSLWTQSTHTCWTPGGRDISAFPKIKYCIYSCVHKHTIYGFIYYKTLAELSSNVWSK